MFLRKSFIPFLFILLFLQVSASAQKASILARGVPEEAGISSKNITEFLDAADKSKTEFHSFMLLRHGKVIAEGWWNPYAANFEHTLYSCSKSFTATAIGFAIDEKKLSLDEKVVSFFPNDLPDTVSTRLAGLTIKDVLMMSDGQDPDPSRTVPVIDSNWIQGFLSTPVIHQPGTQFLYNSLGTYMLSAIIQKVTGQKTLDYLKPRLFDPLGIHGMDWETDLNGINTGGWGLRLKTEDMAKFAELFLQQGKWNGKQILPAWWVKEASTVKIMQDPKAPQSKKDSSDWLQGYCYQMWRCRHNAYRGDGAFGQFMIVMPDQDAVLAITAETADMQEEINLVWKYLLPGFKDKSLPADTASDAALKNKIRSLALPLPIKNKGSLSPKINGKTFIASTNDLHLQKITFSSTNNLVKVTFQTDAGSYPINFAVAKWQAGITNMPGPSLTSKSIENRSMLYPAKIVASYTWKDDLTLELVLRYIESPHTERYTCHFDENKIKIEAARSFDYGKAVTVIDGEIQK
jgi:hypothetical protein